MADDKLNFDASDFEESENDVMISTIDNPFNYFTQFDDWKQFDEDHGYNTLNYLARIAATSASTSDQTYEEAIDSAIDEIYKMNINGRYCKVHRGDKVIPREPESEEDNDQE